MNPSSGESAPQASMSRSDSSRDVSVSVSSFARSSGGSPARSTSAPPCGRISRSVATALKAPLAAGRRVDRSFQTDVRAKPARPDGAAASGCSCCHLRPHESPLLQLLEHEPCALLRPTLLRLESQVRERRLLVGVVDAGEAGDLAGERLLVE